MRDKQLTLRITEEKRLAFAAYAERIGVTTSKILTDFIDRCLEEVATEIESESLTQRLDSLEARLNERLDRLDRLEAAILETKGDASNAVQSVATLAAELNAWADVLGTQINEINATKVTASPPEGADAAAVKLAQQLHSAGCSLRAIAADFNTKNIPTPSGRGKWHASTVGKLII